MQPRDMKRYQIQKRDKKHGGKMVQYIKSKLLQQSKWTMSNIWGDMAKNWKDTILRLRKPGGKDQWRNIIVILQKIKKKEFLKVAMKEKTEYLH